jgi:hypothetical protein
MITASHDDKIRRGEGRDGRKAGREEGKEGGKEEMHSHLFL